MTDKKDNIISLSSIAGGKGTEEDTSEASKKATEFIDNLKVLMEMDTFVAVGANGSGEVAMLTSSDNSLEVMGLLETAKLAVSTTDLGE